MDINKIFGIFDDDEEFFTNQNFNVIDDLNIKDTPIYKIGMFEKMILNIKSAVKFQVIDIFKKSDVDFDLIFGQPCFGETIFNLVKPKFFIDLAHEPIFSPS